MTGIEFNVVLTIRCVCGERKCTLSTTTVTQILQSRKHARNHTYRILTTIIVIIKVFGIYLMETKIIAKIKYLPSNGTTRLVGGIISTTSRKNT